MYVINKLQYYCFHMRVKKTHLINLTGHSRINFNVPHCTAWTLELSCHLAQIWKFSKIWYCTEVFFESGITVLYSFTLPHSMHLTFVRPSTCLRVRLAGLRGRLGNHLLHLARLHWWWRAGRPASSPLCSARCTKTVGLLISVNGVLQHGTCSLWS